MSNNNHTPGPWKIEQGGGRGAWIEGTDGEYAALAAGNTDERANANASLIAAAPELLEALEAFVEEYAWISDKLSIAARAAIAKARAGKGE